MINFFGLMERHISRVNAGRRDKALRSAPAARRASKAYRTALAAVEVYRDIALSANRVGVTRSQQIAKEEYRKGIARLRELRLSGSI